MRDHHPPIPLQELRGLINIVRQLRHECPWDREQTHRSLRDMLIEEAYEVVETIDEHELTGLKNELGDILLHVIMHATIAEEDGEFTLRDVVEEISGKLVRRHPHVFGTKTVRNASEVKKNWAELKMAEGRASVLDGVPKGLPALQQALNVQERASRVGFDWKKKGDVWKKVREELSELQATLNSRSAHRREEELGDFLFALVNYARFLGINPESALRMTIRKFGKRFRYIEKEMTKRGGTMSRATLQEMDELWNRAKKRERGKRRSATA